MAREIRPNCLHRRLFLQRGVICAATAGLVLEIGPAHAKSFKATQKVAGYIERDHPESQMCLQCHAFVPPTDCTLVEGPVSPWGWCNYYED
jgi:hypothetical protein